MATRTTTQKTSIEGVSLRDHFEMRFVKLEEMMQSYFAAYEKALTVALAANEKRLDGLNELRGTMADKDKLYATRPDVDSIKAIMRLEFDRIRSDIESLNLSRAELSGKADQAQVTKILIISLSGLAVSLAGMLMGIITLVVKLSGS